MNLDLSFSEVAYQQNMLLLITDPFAIGNSK